MPFYEYLCEACGKDFVLLQAMNTKAEDTVCPYCNEKVSKKLVSKFTSGGGGLVCSTSRHSWGGG